MRDSLKQLLSSAIVLEYRLPHGSTSKVAVSNIPDDCFKNVSSSYDIKELIYNGLIDYGIEESKIDISRLSKLHKLVLTSKLKYNKDATLETKIKYGFFGEVMLHLMIQHFYATSILVSRGFFYNPLENGETKGYDTFQVRSVINTDEVELWFAEVKFYGDYTQALKSIFTKLNNALKDDYLAKHFNTFVNFYDKMNAVSKATQVVKAFMDDPDLDIIQLLQEVNATLVYPALLICDDKGKGYDVIVKEIVDHINDNYKTITPSLSIPYKFFFMILPVSGSKVIKTDVVQWISSNHALI